MPQGETESGHRFGGMAQISEKYKKKKFQKKGVDKQ